MRLLYLCQCDGLYHRDALRLSMGPRMGLARGSQDLSLDVPGGRLVYFSASRDFLAVCTNPNHRLTAYRCQRQRTARPGRDPRQGRPLGFLMSWLGDSGHLGTREYHAKVTNISLPLRRAAKERLNLAGPMGMQLLAAEDPCKPGHSEEPA